MSINIDELAKAIADALSEYDQAVSDEIKESVEEIAKETVEELKRTSPKRIAKGGGKYAKNWKQKTTSESRRHLQKSVFNDKHYRLTHLLESGHRVAKSSPDKKQFVSARPHIKSAEENAIKRLAEIIKEKLENGR